MLKASLKHIIILTLVVAAGCKAPEITTMDKRSVPATFTGDTSDTNSSGLVNRKSFYTSAHLNELIDTVLANNYDLRTATERIEMAQAMVNQAQGFLRPQVNAVAAPAIRRFGLYTMDGAGNISTDIEKGKRVPIDLPDYYFGLQSSWEIDLWGKLKNRKKAAMARFYSSIEGRNLIQTALVSETANAYYELLAADEVIRVLEQTISLQEEAIELVKVQKEAAMVNELAVQQFQAQLLGLKSYRVEVNQQIREIEGRINLLAGRYPQPIVRDTSFYAIAEPQIIKAGVPSQMIVRRPDIRRAEWELVATKADLEAARAAFFPSLTLNAGVGLQAYKAGLLFRFPESIAYSLIAGISAPIINRTMIKGEFARSNARQREALYEYEGAVVNAFNEVFQGLKRIESLQQIYEMKSKEATISSASIEVSSELFRTGRATYLEVLLARQAALRSNIEMIETRKNQYLATIGVYRALGGY